MCSSAAPDLFFEGATAAPSSKKMLDVPPGGFDTRVVERSVTALPEFWLAPSAKTFADTVFGCAALDKGTSPMQRLDVPNSEYWRPRGITSQALL
mmetsp:Transcript_12051/g.17309  ORF Transcript_12051/g.17309 Transcript_12051/m.17309 type:complete len:95 (+) Transcript_12051:311-595(+)